MYMRTLLVLMWGFQAVACDFVVQAKGVIVDDTTNRPLLGARVSIIDLEAADTTDRSGVFELYQHVGIGVGAELLVEKDGYKPFKIKIEVESGATTYVVARNMKYVEFEDPIYPNPLDRQTLVTHDLINTFSRNFAVSGDSVIVKLELDTTRTERAAPRG